MNNLKVLWVTNSIMPDLSVAMGNKPSVFGGWQFGLARDLTEKGISLTVVTARPNLDDFKAFKNGIAYFLLKSSKQISKYDKTLEAKWKAIVNEVEPDVVHIHGSENALGLSLLKSCPKLNYVLSIQGLISVCVRYYTSGMSFWEIFKSITFRDILKRDTIWQQKRKFHKRGINVEKQYFSKINNIIGRTDWDRYHSIALNKKNNYYFCNESLREKFYTEKKWDIRSKNNHTIFISQAGYPIKGIHQVIKAVNLLKKEFPQIKIQYAGGNIRGINHSFKEKLKIKGYGRYLNQLIRGYKLENHVEYLGILSENEMHRQYLQSHVFVCPSSIENSPNSVGEAQILGVPVVASYVGGTPNMVTNNITGILYRFEEIEMLAQSIKQVFTNDELANKLSENGIACASERHSRAKNCNHNIEIYNTVCGKI